MSSKRLAAFARGVRAAVVVVACGGAIAAVPTAGEHRGERDAATPALRPELAASAVFDARGRLWAVAKQGGHVVLRRSDDFGRTWSVAKRVNAAPEAIAADGEARPRIALGRRGEVYVSWTRPLSPPYTGVVRFARSLDGGRTFSTPRAVPDDDPSTAQRLHALTLDREGRPFVAWLDMRDPEAASRRGEPYRGAAVRYAVSDDRGATFSGPYRIADHGSECCRIALLPRSDGSVAAFWRHVFEPNVRDHAISMLRADGRSERFRRATFDNWAVDSCPHHGPSLAEDAAGRLHAVWFTLGDEPGVLYGRLREGGIDGLRRVGGETAEHPDVAATGKRVAIAWKEFDGVRSQLHELHSNDGGATWRERTLAVVAGPSDQPRMLTHAGRFYVLWNTRAKPLSVYAVP